MGQTKPKSDGKGPLAGVRVADFAWIGAGSYTTKILSDFGADVIKVETATRLDPLRSTGPFKDGKPGVNRSGYFADRNSNKRSIRLNLKHAEGRRLARLLISKSDVVTNNFAPGTMEKFGLGYEVIAAERPDIIYLSMSMQGASGPHSSYVGFGLTIASLAGLQYLCGPADRPPVGTGTNYPDHVPNPTHAAFAVLASLYHRRRSGRGRYIDFSQVEPTVALLGSAIADYAVNGTVAERCANDHEEAAPHGCYPCADERWIAISAFTDQHWVDLAAVLGAQRPFEPCWASLEYRFAHRRLLDAEISTRTVGFAVHQLMHALQARRVPAGAVANIRELIESDDQLAHRGHWIRLDHPEMGKTIYNGPPFRLSRTPADIRRPAPLLGEHTEEVCRDLLGLSSAEFARLSADDVFN